MALQFDPVVSSFSAGEISQQLPYEFPFGTNLTRAKYTQQPATISQRPEFIYSRQLERPGCW